MKKLFKAIYEDNIDIIKENIQKKPELVNCIAKQPPKKDDGQSLLQVALKNGKIEIADFLIESGADINFIESETCANEWRAPVIHDAINLAVMSSRWNINSSYTGFKVCSTKEQADKAFDILKKIIEKGADVNSKDSYGNSCLNRFCLQAKQILPSYNYKNDCESNDRILTEELLEDLKRIYKLLVQNNADISYIAPNFGDTIHEHYKKETLFKIIN